MILISSPGGPTNYYAKMYLQFTPRGLPHNKTGFREAGLPFFTIRIRLILSVIRFCPGDLPVIG